MLLRLRLSRIISKHENQCLVMYCAHHPAKPLQQGLSLHLLAFEHKDRRSFDQGATDLHANLPSLPIIVF
jgi:hypothetical protein